MRCLRPSPHPDWFRPRASYVSTPTASHEEPARVASTAAQRCSEKQSHYLGTGDLVKTGDALVTPELNARPNWYQRLSKADREKLNQEVLDLMAGRS